MDLALSWSASDSASPTYPSAVAGRVFGLGSLGCALSGPGSQGSSAMGEGCEG